MFEPFHGTDRIKKKRVDIGHVYGDGFNSLSLLRQIVLVAIAQDKLLLRNKTPLRFCME